MYHDKKQPTYLDLFAGCGGLSLGFREAGFKCLLAVDADPKAVECYNYNLQGDSVGAVQADLSQLQSHADVGAFLQKHGIHPGDCDVVVGGPPCQSFSVVGRTKVRALMEADSAIREKWEQRSHSRVMLFETYVLFIEYLQPRWFLFENVPAIRSHAIFDTIDERFSHLRTQGGRRLNYQIAHDTYLASKYGVPQNRRRFLMVGHLPETGSISWTKPNETSPPTVEEAIGDLPAIPNGYRERGATYLAPASNPYQERMRWTPTGEDLEEIPNHHCRTHNSDDVALFGRMQPGARFSDDDVQRAIRDVNSEHKLLKYAVDKFQDKLHKLDPDRQAWTVTAHLQKDCYKFIHYSQPRTISVREAARLQSFPDRFVFPLALGPAFRLIGNAVPPLLANVFANSFLRADPGLESLRARARAIVRDDEFARIIGREGYWLHRVRAGVAAAALVANGRSWKEAAELLGYGDHLRLERRFQTYVELFCPDPVEPDIDHSGEQVVLDFNDLAAD